MTPLMYTVKSIVNNHGTQLSVLYGAQFVRYVDLYSALCVWARRQCHHYKGVLVSFSEVPLIILYRSGTAVDVTECVWHRHTPACVQEL